MKNLADLSIYELGTAPMGRVLRRARDGAPAIMLFSHEGERFVVTLDTKAEQPLIARYADGMSGTVVDEGAVELMVRVNDLSPTRTASVPTFNAFKTKEGLGIIVEMGDNPHRLFVDVRGYTVMPNLNEIAYGFANWSMYAGEGDERKLITSYPAKAPVIGSVPSQVSGFTRR